MSDCGDVKKVFVPNSEEKKDPDVNADVKTIVGIEITDIAAEKIVHFIKVDKKSPDEYGLRVSVVKDGCSGNSYTMDVGEIASSKDAGDKFFEKNGATVMVEKLSYLFVTGSVLDYTESLLASGFQLTNPNVKGTCSCGSSFKV
jgi:iron-sulfur cluster assembly protein